MVADRERADWPLIREGAVTLFWRHAQFEETKRALVELGYQLLEVDCTSLERVIAQVSERLRWGEQFDHEPWSGNLNALDEGVAGLPFPESGCFAICLDGFHRLVDQDAVFAIGMLDVIETQSRNHLVDGWRLIGLVQTNDPTYQTEKLGGRAAQWNWNEWMASHRKLT